MTTILIATGYASTRAGFRAMLSGVSDCLMVGEARNIEEALALLASTHPDVMLTDDSVGPLKEHLEELKRSQVALVVLSEEPGVSSLLAQSELRGWGLLEKTAEAEEIVSAILAASANLIVLNRNAIEELTSPAPRLNDFSAGDDYVDPNLTSREMEVLQLMAQGLPNKNIANRLGVSLSTAKFHVASILSKLNVGSRTEAVTAGARSGLVTL